MNKIKCPPCALWLLFSFPIPKQVEERFDRMASLVPHIAEMDEDKPGCYQIRNVM
jgi:hypothetical protein